jgi:hypothetical protein
MPSLMRRTAIVERLVEAANLAAPRLRAKTARWDHLKRCYVITSSTKLEVRLAPTDARALVSKLPLRPELM